MQLQQCQYVSKFLSSSVRFQLTEWHKISLYSVFIAELLTCITLPSVWPPVFSSQGQLGSFYHCKGKTSFSCFLRCLWIHQWWKKYSNHLFMRKYQYNNVKTLPLQVKVLHSKSYLSRSTEVWSTTQSIEDKVLVLKKIPLYLKYYYDVIKLLILMHQCVSSILLL